MTSVIDYRVCWKPTLGKHRTICLHYTSVCDLLQYGVEEASEEVCIIFFDLSKAFDTVPHLPLLHKLSYLQVPPFLLRWIHDYLSNRSQAVVLGGTTSNILPVVSGVPTRVSIRPIVVPGIHRPGCKLCDLQQHHHVCR